MRSIVSPNPRMQSTGVAFLDIVQGAQAVIDGKARTISGVGRRGNKLTVRLTKASPDFLARLDALHAGDRHEPRTVRSTNGINQYAPCGPYYFSSRTPGRSITLKRNPYYKGGRAANVDTIQVNVGNDIAVAVPERREGHVRLRVDGHPADGVEERRPEIRPEQEGRPGAGALAPRRALRGHEPRAPALQGHQRLKSHRLERSTARPSRRRAATSTASGQGRSFRPGWSATSRRASTRSKIRGTLVGRRASSARASGKAVLWSSNSGISAQAQLIQYNLKQKKESGSTPRFWLLPRARQFTNAGNPRLRPMT